MGDHAVRIISAFLVSPLLIKGLGTDSYGLWILVLSFVGYLELLDFGLAVSTVRYFSTALGSNDPHALSPLFVEIRNHYRRVGFVVMLLGVFGGIAFKLFYVAASNTTAIIFFAMAMAVGSTFQVRAYTSLLKAHLKYTVTTMVSSIRVVCFSVALVLLRHHMNLYVLVTLQVSLMLLEQLVLYFSARSLVPPRSETKLTKSQRRDIAAYAGKSTLHNLAAFLRDRLDTQLLAAFASLAAITQYSVGTRIPLLFMDMQNSLFGGHLVAAFGLNSSRKSKSEIRDDLLTVLRLSASGALIGGTLIFTLGPPFIDQWLGAGFKPAHEVLRILIPGVSLLAMQYPCYSLLAALNRISGMAYAALGSAILNFVASFILVQRLGVTGVVWGTGFELSFTSLIVMPYLVSGALEMQPLSYAARVILMPVCKIGLCFGPIAWYLTQVWNPTTYLQLAEAGTVLGITGSAIAWIVVLKSRERTFILGQLPKITRFGAVV